MAASYAVLPWLVIFALNTCVRTRFNALLADHVADMPMNCITVVDHTVATVRAAAVAGSANSDSAVSDDPR